MGKSDKNGDSSEFVQMMLNVIHDTLKDYEDNADQVIDQENDQVKIDNPNLIKLLRAIGDETLSAVQISIKQWRYYLWSQILNLV